MSNPTKMNETPIETKSQLVEILSHGCKPKEAWRIGTEHEKFGFILPEAATSSRQAFSSPSYEESGIKALLEHLRGDVWEGIYDGEALIGLKGQGAQKGSAISLEPAGQFELSGAPLKDLHQTKEEMQSHFELVRAPAKNLGFGFAALGFHPLATREAMPWMPKSRYKIMRQYMPKVGKFGLDMMKRTCTVQVNLDFSDEKDMARKMRVSLALQPLATAIFSNSPFLEGNESGWMSQRAHAWLDTDNARSGQPSLFFQDDFSFEKYVDWVLDVPMYFVNRDGKNIDVAGCSFRKWLEGTEQGVLRSLTPQISDFEDHLTTVFPDVRLKQFLEMRGADAGTSEMMVAQSAFWVGLLYEEDVLEELESYICRYEWRHYQNLREKAAKFGMKAEFADQADLYGLLKDIYEMSLRGLKKRGLGEEIYLKPIEEIAFGGMTQAEYWLTRARQEWQGDISRIFEEAAI